MHLNAIRLQLIDDVNDLGIAQIATVLLERQSQNIDFGTFDVATAGDHVLDGLLGDELPHAIIDTPASQDDLRVVAQHLCLVSQVVGIHANAVAANQAWFETQKVPFGPRCFKHLGGINAHLVKNDGQLVHQRNIQIALGILDHLCSLGCLDAGGPVNPRHNDGFIQLGYLVQGLRRIARHNLENLGQRMLFVTRIDTLRRVTHKKVLFPGQPRFPLQHGNTDILCRTGIDSGLKHHNRAFFHVPRHTRTGTCQRPKVWNVRVVHRRRHRHHNNVRFSQQAGIGGVDRVSRAAHVAVGQLARRINVLTARLHLGLRYIKPNRAPTLAKLHHQGQTHVTQANDRNYLHNEISKAFM